MIFWVAWDASFILSECALVHLHRAFPSCLVTLVYRLFRGLALSTLNRQRLNRVDDSTTTSPLTSSKSLINGTAPQATQISSPATVSSSERIFDLSGFGRVPSAIIVYYKQKIGPLFYWLFSLWTSCPTSATCVDRDSRLGYYKYLKQSSAWSGLTLDACCRTLSEHRGSNEGYIDKGHWCCGCYMVSAYGTIEC